MCNVYEKVIDLLERREDYACVSLYSHDYKKAAKMAHNSGYRIRVIYDGLEIKHAIFLHKLFATKQGAAEIETQAILLCLRFAFEKNEFSFVAGCHLEASIARMCAHMTGYTFTHDEVLNCGGCKMFFRRP